MQSEPTIDLTQPQQPMSPEKAQKLFQELSKTPDTPGHLRKTLSGDVTREYFKILTEKDVIEADWFYATGQMSREQASQYATLIGTYDQTKNKMAQLATQLAAKNISQIHSLIKKDLQGDSKNGLRNLFQMVSNLTAYSPEIYKGKYALYNSLSLTFRITFSSLVGAKLVEIFEASNDPLLKNYIREFLELAEQISQRDYGIQFIGIQTFNEIEFYKRAITNPSQRNELDKTVNYIAPLNKEKREKLELEAALDLEEVRKEASYKKILLHEIQSATPQIVFLGDDNSDSSGDRYAQFCAFRINFNKSFKIGMPLIEATATNTTYDYSNIEGVVNCTLNPITGELQLITNGSINLSTILDPDRYLLLKAYLIKELKEHLAKKEPDLDDLFAPSVQEALATRQEETKIDVKNVEEVTDKDDAPQESEWQYQPYVKSVSNEGAENVDTNIEVAESSEDLKSLPKHKRKIIIDKIWGARGADVISALTRLMDGKVRQEGSHAFFYSERTNQTLPVPVGSSIAPPLIMANLKNWGYSLMEYALELGAKI